MDYFNQAFSAAFLLIISFDHEVYTIVWTSLRISLVAVIAASLIGIPLGLLVQFRSFPGKAFLMQMLNTLMALPTVVVGLLLYGLLTRQGPLGDWGLLYTPAAIIIGECILILPIIWNLTITAAASADPRVLLTCRALGARGIQQGLLFINEVRFALVAAVVTGFGRAIGEVGVAMMLGGNISGFTRTMTTAIALETSKGEFEFGLALGLLLLLTAFIVNLVLQRFQSLNK
ncbi:MAG: ABC transporter permease [Gammaproteobacteria bacterium]